MAGDAAEPKGYHVMMPPGWVRYMTDADGKRALIAQATARMRQLSRPDLDAQARTMIESYWRTLTSNRISAVYLPSDSEAGALAPLSLAVKQHASAPGVPFGESLPAIARAPIETFETQIGTIFRWQRDSRGQDELAELRSRQVGYGFPLPGEGERRGVVFLTSIAYLDETDPETLALLTEASDTIMETFRWR